MNLFKKQQPKFMTKEELQVLRDRVDSRKEEIGLRKEQAFVENEYKTQNKIDLDKLKKYLIIGVCGIFIAIIVWKVVMKFI